ncbi:uncharacterized protein LOC110618448 [Manihot esculenta]|uniref:uncharacterized protein LOC110618448 n=1 Tax=Manihot esculenta TaxID=3983 RepID=UPI001CC64721|nr:uncharacterized protein LOC110618448 [Manihot esculenta]
MAASSSKKICEHLQEQQESFVLDIQRPSMSNLTRRRILHTRKILKLIFYKLICSNHSKQRLNCHKAHIYELKLLQSGGSKRYSSRGSSVAWYESSMCGMKDSPCKKNQAAVLAETCQPHERSSFIEQQCKEDGGKLGPGSLPFEAIRSNTGSNIKLLI